MRTHRSRGKYCRTRVQRDDDICVHRCRVFRRRANDTQVKLMRTSHRVLDDPVLLPKRLTDNNMRQSSVTATLKDFIARHCQVNRVIRILRHRAFGGQYLPATAIGI